MISLEVVLGPNLVLQIELFRVQLFLEFRNLPIRQRRSPRRWQSVARPDPAARHRPEKGSGWPLPTFSVPSTRSCDRSGTQQKDFTPSARSAPGAFDSAASSLAPVR